MKTLIAVCCLVAAIVGYVMPRSVIGLTPDPGTTDAVQTTSLARSDALPRFSTVIWKDRLKAAPEVPIWNDFATELRRDDFGMFRTTGYVGSQSFRFLIDSGAYIVTLTSGSASKLKNVKQLGPRTTITATGEKVTGTEIILPSLQVGMIHLDDVHALVISGTADAENLLGLSFLNRINWSYAQDRQVLVLER